MNTATIQTINLLLVDDHAMFRESLARVLEKEPGMRVVGQCGSSSEALAVLGKSAVNMVLLDVDLGRQRALDFVLTAKRQGFEGQILIVTAGISGRRRFSWCKQVWPEFFTSITRPTSCAGRSGRPRKEELASNQTT